MGDNVGWGGVQICGTQHAVVAAVTPSEFESLSPKRVLLVDDDASLRAVVAETLRGEGYVVHEAHNGAEGPEQLRAARPDLILLDLGMPVLNGHGFIAASRVEVARADIPIVIVSAAPVLPDRPQEAGVKAVLLKPFDLGVLVAMVERLTRAVAADIGPSQAKNTKAGGVAPRHPTE